MGEEKSSQFLLLRLFIINVLNNSSRIELEQRSSPFHNEMKRNVKL